MARRTYHGVALQFWEIFDRDLPWSGQLGFNLWHNGFFGHPAGLGILFGANSFFGAQFSCIYANKFGVKPKPVHGAEFIPTVVKHRPTTTQ